MSARLERLLIAGLLAAIVAVGTVAHVWTQTPSLMFIGSSGGTVPWQGSATGVPFVSMNGGIATLGAGSSTDTGKAPLTDCYNQTFTDAGVVNQWNVFGCTLGASALATVGDTLHIRVAAMLAANVNTKGWQLWWNGGTCSGTGGSCCASGTQVYSDGSASSGVATLSDYFATRTSSGNQNISGITYTGTASVSSVDSVTSATTDTSAIPIVWCIRNTSAGAASISGIPTLRTEYWGK